MSRVVYCARISIADALIRIQSALFDSSSLSRRLEAVQSFIKGFKTRGDPDDSANIADSSRLQQSLVWDAHIAAHASGAQIASSESLEIFRALGCATPDADVNTWLPTYVPWPYTCASKPLTGDPVFNLHCQKFSKCQPASKPSKSSVRPTKIPTPQSRNLCKMSMALKNR